MLASVGPGTGFDPVRSAFRPGRVSCLGSRRAVDHHRTRRRTVTPGAAPEAMPSKCIAARIFACSFSHGKTPSAGKVSRPQVLQNAFRS